MACSDLNRGVAAKLHRCHKHRRRGGQATVLHCETGVCQGRDHLLLHPFGGQAGIMAHRDRKAVLFHPVIQPAGKAHCHAVYGLVRQIDCLSSLRLHRDTSDIRSAFKLPPFFY